MTSGMVAITMAGADDELRQLAAWLRDEDELRGRVQLSQGPPVPGQMGAVLDSVVVAVTSGSASTFCRSLFGWLGRRRDATKVSLQFKRSGEKEELSLDCGSATDAESVLAAVRDYFDREGA